MQLEITFFHTKKPKKLYLKTRIGLVNAFELRTKTGLIKNVVYALYGEGNKIWIGNAIELLYLITTYKWKKL